MIYEQGAIYRHKKRGTRYELVGRAKMQISWQKVAGCHVVHAPELVAQDLERVGMVVYRALADDTLWVRPESEFLDGRFELVEHKGGAA